MKLPIRSGIQCGGKHVNISIKDVLQPQNIMAVVRKQCQGLIKHNKKSESDINNLNNCSKFRHLIKRLKISDRLDWFVSS